MDPALSAVIVRMFAASAGLGMLFGMCALMIEHERVKKMLVVTTGYCLLLSFGLLILKMTEVAYVQTH